MLLLDARCPPLHIPTSLRAHVQALKPRKEVVLVLTKSDLVDPGALEGWRKWAKEWWAEGLREKERARVERQSLGRLKREERAKSGDGAGVEGAGEVDAERVQVVCVRSYDTDLLYAGECSWFMCTPSP